MLLITSIWRRVKSISDYFWKYHLNSFLKAMVANKFVNQPKLVVWNRYFSSMSNNACLGIIFKYWGIQKSNPELKQKLSHLKNVDIILLVGVANCIWCWVCSSNNKEPFLQELGLRVVGSNSNMWRSPVFSLLATQSCWLFS